MTERSIKLLTRSWKVIGFKASILARTRATSRASYWLLKETINHREWGGVSYVCQFHLSAFGEVVTEKKVKKISLLLKDLKWKQFPHHSLTSVSRNSCFQPLPVSPQTPTRVSVCSVKQSESSYALFFSFFFTDVIYFYSAHFVHPNSNAPK